MPQPLGTPPPPLRKTRASTHAPLEQERRTGVEKRGEDEALPPV